MRAWLCAAATAALIASIFAGGAAAQSRPPVEAFGQLPALSDPCISPDGKYLAFIQAYNGQPVAAIYAIDAPPETAPARVKDATGVVAFIQWVKNDRLAVGIKGGMKAGDENTVYTWKREITVNPYGGDVAILNENQSTFRFNVDNWGVIDIDLGDPDRIFMPLFTFTHAGTWSALTKSYLQDGQATYRFDVMEVDARTGKSAIFESGTPDTYVWYMDGHGHVVARIDETEYPLEAHVKYYDGQAWHDGETIDLTDDKGAGPEGVSEDGQSMVVSEYDADQMKVVVAHPLNKTGISTTLFSNSHYDVSTPIFDDWTGRVVGATYADDKMEYVYFDPQLEALQRGLEQAFPGVSVHAASSDAAKNRVIVEVDAPQEPISYYLLDRTTHQAKFIASSYPGLRAADLGEMKPWSYKARDGLDIPAYLTFPPGGTGKNLPLVVLPHGGPGDRDTLGFDWQSQFFANRGYAVFQPNFRGSSGYGYKFKKAGFHQWGLEMQDDITDGVKKLIADGVVDPKRICIVGGSYGGYAALAGAAFTPDLYACAVSFAGVSDLQALIAQEGGSDTSFVDPRIGTDADPDRLRATSPARHVGQVKCPILLMHGEYDTTVRIKQSELMFNMLKAAGKDVQFIRFPGEDHYFDFADTRIRFLTETEKFLEAHIGPGVTAQK